MQQAIAQTVKFMGEHQVVYVLCRAGMNRSGVVVAGAIASLYMNAAEAIRRVQERRPGALYNWWFKKLLLDGKLVTAAAAFRTSS